MAMAPYPEEVTPIEIREMYLELNRNESRIIHERLKGMLTFEGLLFTAVGVTATSKLFFLGFLVAVMGLLACVPWYIAVRGSYRGTSRIGDIFKAFNQSLNEKSQLPDLDAITN